MSLEALIFLEDGKFVQTPRKELKEGGKVICLLQHDKKPNPLVHLEKNVQVHITNEKEVVLKNIACTICPKKFTTKRARNHHIKTVHEKKAQKKCDVCQKEFIHLNTFKNHLCVRKEYAKLACEKCEKTFLTKTLLREHMQVHFPKQFSCEKCQKLFVQKSSLNHHKRTKHSSQ